MISQPPTINIIHGKALEVLKIFPDNHFHSVVTDPPYGLGKEPNIVEVMHDWVTQGYHEITGGGFMGKTWDAFVPQPIEWKEVYRVLKPGGYMLVACGTRTQDWMVSSLRFAGFEVRDVITWHYGSGFPKSLDVSKAIDKHFGKADEREVVGVSSTTGKRNNSSIDDKAGKEDRTFSNTTEVVNYITAPATAAAAEYSGYGTALKPATEFWTLVRKPLEKGLTVAQNMLKWGTGGINIDGSRIEYEEDDRLLKGGTYGGNRKSGEGTSIFGNGNKTVLYGDLPQGRWPANVIFDEFTADLLDEQSGETKSGKVVSDKDYYDGESITGFIRGKSTSENQYGDIGGASRFFYVAKASRSERNKGLEGLGFFKEHNHSRFDTCEVCGKYIFQNPERENSHCNCETPIRKNLVVHGNHHPTVKPISLMQYLVKLITPKAGHCLDPYNGSGTTGIACKLEGFAYTGIEQEADFVAISNHRIAAWEPEPLIKTSRKNGSLSVPDNPNQLTFF